MKNRITSAVAVYLVLENKLQEILIARRCNTGYQDGMYQVPAGHLETGELPTEALIRDRVSRWTAQGCVTPHQVGPSGSYGAVHLDGGQES